MKTRRSFFAVLGALVAAPFVKRKPETQEQHAYIEKTPDAAGVFRETHRKMFQSIDELRAYANARVKALRPA